MPEDASSSADINANARAAPFPIATLAIVAHSAPPATAAGLRAIGGQAEDNRTTHQLAGDKWNRQVELLAAIFGGCREASRPDPGAAAKPNALRRP